MVGSVAGMTVNGGLTVETELDPELKQRLLFRRAFTVTALNPKSIAFFVAFLPQFVNPTVPPGAQLIVLGTTFLVALTGDRDVAPFLMPTAAAALLLATSFRKSNQVLAMRNSYHGRSFTAVALTSHRAWSPTGYSGLNVQYVQGPYKANSI